MVLVPAGGGTDPERAGRLVRDARMDLTAALHQLHFLHPAWLMLAPLLLLFAAWMWYRQSRAGAWSQVVDADLVPSLRLEPGGGASGPWLLFATVWTLSLLAIAGPAWQRLPSIGYRAPDDWVIVLDLSPSMAVADVSPDRRHQSMSARSR